ncbi:MAG: polyphosphate:AMP phosphotransferase [Ruminococcus sp.]|nr:polyphosphate:AMP phosphotransferase [Ruminococcus sp.]
MLNDVRKPVKGVDYKARANELRQTLSNLQLRMKEKQLPAIIVFEGWGASGKGTLIADTIKLLDPRFFKVSSTLPPNDAERRYPMMKRFFEGIPEYGKLSVMDRSWYQELAVARLEDGISRKEYDRRISSVNTFERQLTDDGYVIIKVFLHISKEEQKRRFDKLESAASTKWRVTDKDRRRNKHYDEYFELLDDMLERTDTELCPWTVIDAEDKQFARCRLFETIIETITAALEADTIYPPESNVSKLFGLKPMPKLSEVELTGKTVSREDYELRLKEAQKELAKLHGKLYKKKIPVILAFEGWDAAGKGGAIKRVGAALDPRGYEAVPIASPDAREKAHHYLWRFWTRLPKDGHITIFDRTWYGRVMVERLEGFTPVERCAMAYREIDEFEKELTDCGFVILKFWIQIDKDEQLKRFNDRMNTPEKRWKITDEDWRNREKWDLYESAVDEMIQKTSTVYAPWTIVEGNDKLYARLKVLDTVIARLRDELAKRSKK